MGPTTLAYALAFLDRLPALLALGADLNQLIREHREKQELFAAEARDPTDAEWDSLNKRLDDLEKQLQA